jgi:hypothetical protein
MNENASIALAIMDDVAATISGGYSQTLVPTHIARAQVYATLATVQSPPSQWALTGAIRNALDARGVELTYDDIDAAADAVARLL